MASRRPLTLKHAALITGACFLMLDRLFKSLALKGYNGDIFGDSFSFSLFKNYQAALSISFGFDIIFIAAPIALIALILLIISWKKNRPQTAALLFLVFGATSNLYDRLNYGYVIDYLEIFKLNALNLADLMIVAAAFVLALREFSKKEN